MHISELKSLLSLFLNFYPIWLAIICTFEGVNTCRVISLYKMEFKDLRGKVVVITGATSGIGRASAVEFAKHGANLVICGRNSEGLEETRQMCVAQGIGVEEVSIVLGDLLKDESLDLIVKTAVDNFGKVDVLHLNAGAVHPINGPVTSPQSVESLDFYYEMYIKYPYKLTQKMSAELIKSKGSIVLTSGLCASSHFVIPFFTGIGIMEAGHQQIGRLFALTLANKGVRFNMVEPGGVRTPILSKVKDMTDPLTICATKTPLGSELPTPEEIAHVVVFLASDQSACMTGCKLTTDRGFSLTHPAVDWKQF